MSLFKAREWWSSKLGDEEEFDKGCLCLANIDNDSDGEAKLCVGSFSGMLRIFYPKQRDYHVDDLLLETDLGAPILQLACGTLAVNGRGVALAVLHPRKMIVYTISSQGAQVAGGASYWTLNKCYEHTLERTACNMVVGPFGGVTGNEHVSSKLATVMATYTTAFGEPRSATAELVLPLCLMARIVSPLKNATHKITIDCNRMPPPMSVLFEDMLTQQATFNPDQSSASSHILTFVFHIRRCDHPRLEECRPYSAAVWRV